MRHLWYSRDLIYECRDTDALPISDGAETPEILGKQRDPQRLHAT